MSRNISFSVAICTYNGGRFLQQQLDSIARQDQPPAEVVLCDDGSTDYSCAVAERFASEVDFPVRVLRNPQNLGYAANFKQAVSLCTQELIALCDQDDWWRPDKLRTLSEQFHQGGSGVGGVFSDGSLMNTSGNPLPGDLWSQFRFTRAAQQRWTQGFALEELVRRNVVTGMTFAIRRPWVRLMDAMPAGWHHDAWVALLLADHATILPCPERLVTYRVHESQQVGVPVSGAEKRRSLQVGGFEKYLRNSRERNLRDYRHETQTFGRLLQAAESGQVQVSPRLRSLAKGKADHATRALQQLEKPRLGRWPAVFGAASDYAKYAPTGWPAMVRDLLL